MSQAGVQEEIDGLREALILEQQYFSRGARGKLCH